MKDVGELKWGFASHMPGSEIVKNTIAMETVLRTPQQKSIADALDLKNMLTVLNFRLVHA